MRDVQNTFCTKAQAQWSAFSQEVDDVVGLACRSVRELGELDYETESEEGQAEELMATLEVSPCRLRGQSVKLVTTENADPVIKEVKIDRPPSVWGLSVEKVISAQTKDEDLEIIQQWLEGATSPSDGAIFLASPGAKFY